MLLRLLTGHHPVGFWLSTGFHPAFALRRQPSSIPVPMWLLAVVVLANFRFEWIQVGLRFPSPAPDALSGFRLVCSGCFPIALPTTFTFQALSGPALYLHLLIQMYILINYTCNFSIVH